MIIKNVIEKIEEMAPLVLAEDWDNTGLLSGDIKRQTDAVVICLDINEEVFKKCMEINAGLCICHHPYIFNPITRFDYKDPYNLLLSKFIKNDIAIYAAHTNLDACTGGVNDCLAKKLEIKIIDTFLPQNPFTTDLENAVPGIGRIGIINNNSYLFEFCKTLGKKLGTVGFMHNFETDRKINRVLIIGGSYDSQWNENVVEHNIDLIISGEIKHRDLMFFQRYDIAAIAVGHDVSERVVLKPLAEYLENYFPDLKFDVLFNLDYNRVVF